MDRPHARGSRDGSRNRLSIFKNYFKFQMFLSKFQKLMSICNFIIENHEYQGQFENLQVLTPWLQKTMTFLVDPTC
jgi:hypothetical protein